MQPYSAAFAKAHLSRQDGDLRIGSRRYRAETEDAAGWIREIGPDGEQKHSINYVMGGKNIYYFLTPLDRGRLQVLPLAYDIHERAWYDTARSGVRHFADREDEALDWRDRSYTFNTTCFNCHVTNLAANYDLATDTYHTQWSEPGVRCESCHGPGQAHVYLMGSLKQGETPGDVKIIRTTRFSTGQLNDMCATCHAKMMPTSLDFLPGEKFFDHYDMVLLDHPDYYPDGRDLGENYTLTSWMMSSCVRSGKLDCSHCHTSSGRFRFVGHSDQSCIPCHEKTVEQRVVHGHHQAGSQGNSCVGCHMPMTRFAGMNRTDHSMRPPMPAATMALQSPNACNLCHTDRDAAWADRWCATWYPDDYQAETIRRAGLIEAARRQQWNRLPEILDELNDKNCDEVFKASYVRLLADCGDNRKWPAFSGPLSANGPDDRTPSSAGSRPVLPWSNPRRRGSQRARTSNLRFRRPIVESPKAKRL